MILIYYRLVKAYDDLDEYVKSENELEQTKEYIAALEILGLAKQQIGQQ